MLTVDIYVFAFESRSVKTKFLEVNKISEKSGFRTKYIKGANRNLHILKINKIKN